MKSSTTVCVYPSHTPHLVAFPYGILFLSSFSDKQHIRHCICFGGELYPHSDMVDAVLQPEPGAEKKVLDIGASPSCCPAYPSPILPPSDV